MLAIHRKYALTALGRRYVKDLVFRHGTNCSNDALQDYGLRVFASWYDKTPKEARSCFIKGVPLKKRWPRKVYSDVLKASGIFDHNLCIGSIEHLVVFPTIAAMGSVGNYPKL